MGRSSVEHPRQLVAVWFADVVAYSCLASVDEDAAVSLIGAFQRHIADVLGAYGGRLVKFVGDAALAEFTSTDSAARSALELIGRFQAETGRQVRVGIHLGDVAKTPDGDILGDGVNVAARLQTQAEAGQVLVSEAAWQQLRSRSGYRFEPLGKRSVKGRSEPIQVFALTRAAAPGTEAGKKARRWRGRVGSLGGRLFSRRAGPPALAALLAAGVWLGSEHWTSRQGPARSAVGDELPEFDPARVAVLYFDDHSRGRELGYLADGLTEAIIHELAQVSALKVISRNGVKPFRGGSVPLDSVVAVLRVGSIVEGSVTESGGIIRVTVQLVDAASGAHLESRVLEHRSSDLLALQDELVQQVADILRTTLGREIRLRQARRGATDPLAWELVLRASSLRSDVQAVRAADVASRRRLLLNADSLLVRAEALDPNWGYPIILRGWIARDLALLEGPVASRYDREWADRALKHANRAVAVLPDDAEAFELRGFLAVEAARGRGDESRETLVRAAEADLRRALELDERRARAWLGLSELLLDQARFTEAKLAAEHALATDAFLEIPPDVLFQLSYSAIQLGELDEASRYCQLGRNRYPERGDFLLCQLTILASFPQLGPDVRRAWVLADSMTLLAAAQDRDDLRRYGWMWVAEVAARAGLADSARALARRARAGEPIPDFAYNEAHIRLLLGERDAAVDLLSEFLSARPEYKEAVANDWLFSELRTDSRFRALVGTSD